MADQGWDSNARRVDGQLEQLVAAMSSAGLYGEPVRSEQVRVLSRLKKPAEQQRYLQFMASTGKTRKVGLAFSDFGLRDLLGLRMTWKVRDVLFWGAGDMDLWSLSGDRGSYPDYKRTFLPRTLDYFAILCQAGATAVAIYTLDVWTSETLDTEPGTRIDLAGELTHIAIQAADALAVLVELGEPPAGDSADATHARSLIHTRWDALDVVRRELTAHLVALDIYHERLAEVDEQERNVHHAQRAENVDSRIDTLIHRTGIDNIQNAALHRAADNIEISLTARSQALAAVRGDYLAALPTL